MSVEDRCVIDTNACVSAVLFNGSKPAQAFDRTVRRGRLLASLETLEELARVLSRSKFDRYAAPTVRNEFVEFVRREAILIEPTETIRVCRDPNDDKFLELAVAGWATCIVTGDEDLLALHPFRGIPVLTPTQFLESLAR